jgi:hypothetical protein
LRLSFNPGRGQGNEWISLQICDVQLFTELPIPVAALLPGVHVVVPDRKTELRLALPGQPR